MYPRFSLHFASKMWKNLNISKVPSCIRMISFLFNKSGNGMMPPGHYNFLFGLFLVGVAIIANYFDTYFAVLTVLLIVALLFKEMITPEFPQVDKFDEESDLYEDFFNY